MASVCVFMVAIMVAADDGCCGKVSFPTRNGLLRDLGFFGKQLFDLGYRGYPELCASVSLYLYHGQRIRKK